MRTAPLARSADAEIVPAKVTVSLPTVPPNGNDRQYDTLAALAALLRDEGIALANDGMPHVVPCGRSRQAR